MGLQTPPGLLNFSFTPPSVPDKLHTLTIPSMHFHTKLNRFRRIAYSLVTMTEIVSNTALLEMCYKNEKLQYKLRKY